MTVSIQVRSSWSVMLAGIVVLTAATATADPVPQNVDHARLGDARSSLSLELVQVPYYVGENLILRVTVRNTHPKPMFLPLPTGLLVNERFDPYSSDPSIHGHACFSPAVEDDSALPRCIERLKARSVLFAPGQTRSALWATRPLAQMELGDPRPLTYGVLFSGHGLVNEAHLRVTLHRFSQAGRERLLKSPTRGHSTYYFVAPAWVGQFLVLGFGGWHPHLMSPPPFDVAMLNERGRHGLTRYAIVSKPDVTLEMDAQGHLLVDGVRRDPPSVMVIQSGWVTAAKTNNPPRK